jgi:hypothetical protein
MEERLTSPRLRVEQRRTTVARLYLQQRTQAEIASAVRVNQGTVSRDLKAIQVEWQQQRLDDFARGKLRELARIDQLEREYWEAWERSCQSREQTVQEKSTTPAGDRLKAGTRTEGRDGNPEFLRGVERCIDLRCKITGTFAAMKIAPTTPDGQEEWHASADETNAVLSAAFTRLGLALGRAGGPGTANEFGQALAQSGADPEPGGNDPGPLADQGAPDPENADPAPLFAASGEDPGRGGAGVADGAAGGTGAGPGADAFGAPV